MSEHCLFCGSCLSANLDACGHCGAIRETRNEKRVGAPCPRCHDVRLIQFALGEVALQACGRCQGSFLAATEWDNLLDSFEKRPLPEDLVISEAPARPAESFGASPYREATPGPAEAERARSEPNLDEPVSCPTCEAVMERLEFSGVSNIIVDVCKSHGIWLDGGELSLVVENARKNPAVPSMPVDEEARDYALRRSLVDVSPREPSLATVMARRLIAVTKRVVALKEKSG